MSEAELVYSPHSELPNGSEKCDCDQMLQDSTYDLHKPRIGAMLFPQFPSLVRDCRELQARPLKSPKDLALLSSGVVPNERVWSGYIQKKCGIEEKLGHSIDTRGMFHSICLHVWTCFWKSLNCFLVIYRLSL
jgi:hypothetical protein